MNNFDFGQTVVTGGAGLIGSAVIWGLNNLNHKDIWLVDWINSLGKKQRNLENLLFERSSEPDHFRNLITQNSIELKKVKTVIHLGACSSTTETNQKYLDDNNFLYTKEICEWCLEENVRFVYASSAATYGDGSSGMSDLDDDIEKFKPLNLYGWSKHNFDLLAKENGWLDHITGLKYFNVFGPNEEHKGDMRSVVSKAFSQIKNTEGMTLFKSHKKEFKDGEQKRDFLYIKDAVNMTIWLTQNTKATGLFNLGNGLARTWLDLGLSIFSALKLSPNIKFVDMPEILREKYQYFTQAETTKLKDHGFKSELFSLEEAVQDYVCNYLNSDSKLGA